MKKTTVAIATLGQAAVLLGGLGAPARAQEDFRHLDEGRPIRVEDAYALKHMEWEWQLGAGLGLAQGDPWEGEGALELKVGLLRNLQVGVEAHGAVRSVEAAGRTSGLEELALHALYNITQEGRRFPAVGVRFDAALPGTGDVGREGAAGRVKAMATRGIRSARLHLNAARSWGQERQDAAWSGGLGFDLPLGLTSRALVADVFAVSVDDESRVRVFLGAGTRMQMTKQSVLDLGLSVRVDTWSDGGRNLGLVVGWSRSFGFGRLARVPPYRMPALKE